MRLQGRRGNPKLARMRPVKVLPSALLVLAVFSCRENPFQPADYNADWTQETHGETAPNYGVVFPQDSVNRIEIYMTAADWATIRTEMKALWGFDFGANDHPCCGPYPANDPAYVDARVVFKGKTWKHVGFRPKGNSSLHYAWNLGNYKFPFRLKFDALEDQFPETFNQRFYGFKDMSMSAMVTDRSGVRERIASELFRQGGVAAPMAASYRVYIDFGEGLVYNGLYTFNELPDDTMTETQLGEKSGNIYKPESNLKSFKAEEFPRNNNQESTNYSDVEALIAALNNTTLQKSDPARWRANLEATFDVDRFLKFLAVNNVIASFDQYGYIAHNYYLYNHSSKHITWIPWDQDLSFNEDPPANGEVPRTNRALSLDMAEVDSYWPLIRYVMDDPTYAARYRANVKNFYDNIFTQAKIDALIDKYIAMTQPNILGTNGEIAGHTYVNTPGEFLAELPYLKGLVASRRAKVAQFLK
jgi:hypothetical protein